MLILYERLHGLDNVMRQALATSHHPAIGALPLWAHHNFDGFTIIHCSISSRNAIEIDRHVEDR